MEEFVNGRKGAHLVRYPLRRRGVRIVGEDALDRASDRVDGRDHSGADDARPGGVERLVGEERDDDERPAGGQRAERRPRASVAEDEGGVRQHVRLRHPLLDVDVGRYLTQLELASDGVSRTRTGSSPSAASALPYAPAAAEKAAATLPNVM